MLSRRMRGLQNEHVSSAHILSELDAHFAACDSIRVRAPQRHVQVAGDLRRERRIGIAREQRDRQRAKFICLRHRPCSKWLGWKDSNLRMAGSKPAALPLGATPTWKKTDDRHQPDRHPPNEGESSTPGARKPLNSGGTLRIISCARSMVSQAKKTQAPVPVRRAEPKTNSQSSACATSGYRRRTTPKQSFLPPDARKP